MKKFLLGFTALLFIGCTHHGIPQHINNAADNYNVEFLFEYKGVEIYRFKDGGRLRYFAIGNGSVMDKQIKTNGKHVTSWESSVLQELPCERRN